MSFVYEEDGVYSKQPGFRVGHYKPNDEFEIETWFPYKVVKTFSGNRKADPDSFQEARAAAAKRCRYLNGGN